MVNDLDIRLTGKIGTRIPFVPVNTSGRLVMSGGQDKKTPVIAKPEDAIVQTGYTKQLNEKSMDIRVLNESIVIKVIKRQTEVDSNPDDYSSLLLLLLDVELNQLIHIVIPRYYITGTKFGFEYIIEENYILGLRFKDTIPAGTVLARTNNTKEGTYRKGRCLNTYFGTLPGSNEDCTLMSDRVPPDFAIKQYSVHKVGFGKSSYLASAYVDRDGVAKPFPGIGDYVTTKDLLYSKHSLDLKALKNEDNTVINDAMLYTKKGLSKRRPHYVKNKMLHRDGRVVNVEIIYNSKSGESIESNESGDQLATYMFMQDRYYRLVSETYDQFKKLYDKATVSPATTNLIRDAYIYLERPIDGKTPNINKSEKRVKLDMYTLKITVEHTVVPNQGAKFTCMYAGKGVVKIVPHEDMPRDADGNIADVAVLSRGIVARTNLGKLYEQYFTKSSRDQKKIICEMLGVKKDKEIDNLSTGKINRVYDYLLEYLSHFGTKQYKLYAGMVDDSNFVVHTDLTGISGGLSHRYKVEILKEIFYRELYLVYNLDEDEIAYDIMSRLEETKFKLKTPTVFVKNRVTGEFVASRSRGIIAPLYTVMLDKLADSFLGASTFFLNGYGLPTGASKEDGRFNYIFKAVKGWGESEIRLGSAYASPRLIQKLLDRSRSIVNHRKWYRSMLQTGTLTEYDLIKDRAEDADVPTNMVNAILGSAGAVIETKPLTLERETYA